MYADSWNVLDQKELQINSMNTNITTSNFVDTDINSEGSTFDLFIHIHNTKRGHIDTGSGNDEVSVTVGTNDSCWFNAFYINTNEGDDKITLQNDYNSFLTELYINAGTGNDLIDVTGILANDNPEYLASERAIDGGNGNDTIKGSQGNDLIYGGRGNDTTYAGIGTILFMVI